VKCRLIRSIFGLKQEPRAWQIKLEATLKHLGFLQGCGDKCIYYTDTSEGRMIVLFYVDGALVSARSMALVNGVNSTISENFDICNLGETTLFWEKRPVVCVKKGC
jgi:hypothetical protein